MDVSDGQIEIYIWDIFSETILAWDERETREPAWTTSWQSIVGL